MLAWLRLDKHIHVGHLPGDLNTQLGQALSQRPHHSLLHNGHSRVAAGKQRLAGQIHRQVVNQALLHNHPLPPIGQEVDVRRKNDDCLRRRLDRLAN